MIEVIQRNDKIDKFDELDILTEYHNTDYGFTIETRANLIDKDFTKSIAILNNAVTLLIDSIAKDDEDFLNKIIYTYNDKAMFMYIDTNKDNPKLPIFLGKKYSNIGFIRKLAVNLSGQFGKSIKVYV